MPFLSNILGDAHGHGLLPSILGQEMQELYVGARHEDGNTRHRTNDKYMQELYVGAKHEDGNTRHEDHMHGADKYQQELFLDGIFGAHGGLLGGHGNGILGQQLQNLCSGSACNQMHFLQDLCSGSDCNQMHFLQNLTADPLSEGIHHLTDGSIINIIG